MPEATTSSRLSPAALGSVVVGLTGPIGLAFGYWCLYRINASDGRLRGRYVAYVGTALGAITSTALFLGGVAIVVNQLRLASGRAECTNNLRQVGAAVQQYHDRYQAFPTGTNGPAGLRPVQRLSFFATLLPYLEQRPGAKGGSVAAKLNFQEPWDAPANASAVTTTIPCYLCRDDTGRLPDVRGITNYVGLTGIGFDSALLPKDSPRAGFFGHERAISRDDVKAGTSNVIMLTETTLDNGPWVAGGRPTLRYLPVNDVKIGEQVAGVVGSVASGHSPGSLLAAPLLTLWPADDVQYLGPGRPFGGLHRGGANVLHVDGSVLFLNDTINPEVFRSLVPLRNEMLDLVVD